MLVKPIKCRRCNGEGSVDSRVVYAGAPGVCFKCAGHGVVEGDKATIAAAKVGVELRKSFATAAWDWDEANRRLADGTRNRGGAKGGHMHLEVEDPIRFAKAVASFAAGRTDVFPALVAYFASHTCTIPAAPLVHF